MTFRPNTRRVYTSWGKAASDARGWGYQTGWKHRVQRYRSWWVVRRTGKRIGPFGPPRAVYLGEFRMSAGPALGGLTFTREPPRLPVVGVANPI